MNNKELIKLAEEVFYSTEGNHVTIAETGREIDLFDLPIIGFSAASDPVYETFKKPEIIGPRYMTPKEWMPEAKTVVSMVFPFSEEVRDSSRNCEKDPSIEWLYGRVEGHAFMQKCMRNLVKELGKKGIRACIPADDERYTRYPRDYKIGDVTNRHIEIVWSERHAGYASGQGTFGLSRCLITKRGSAMRLINCIIDAELEPTEREYSNYMEYCTLCGACIRRCPVGAISKKYGKNNIFCGDWNNDLKKRHYPRYGCSGCMTGVPCEFGIPKKQKRH